ncbi:nucleoid-associated protein [Tissierella praeacuta]|uniref:nucleoid-associated protein n=1 Tax=Tissierella praeacuta TaxID=43131 RepID=UPI003DA2DC02
MLRNIKETRILKAIVHILDNEEDIKIFNDFELEMGEKINTLLTTHIIKSINEDLRRLAKFESEKNIVKEACQEIIADDHKFINNSKIIASYLYDSMKSRPNISPANFVICLCITEGTKFISLLKMDFNENFQTKVEDIEGKIKISIISTGMGIPSKNQKIQKCAFIKSYDETSEYDIILLDKQAIKSKKDNLVSDFFAISFLHCKLARTDSDNTRDFKTITQKFIYSNFSDNPQKTSELQQLLVSTLQTGESVNVVSFAEQAFGNDARLLEDYKNIISSKIGDHTFDIDEETVNKTTRNRTYTTDTGFKITSKVEATEEDDKFEIKQHEEDPNVVDIIIKNVKKLKIDVL